MPQRKPQRVALRPGFPAHVRRHPAGLPATQRPLSRRPGQMFYFVRGDLPSGAKMALADRIRFCSEAVAVRLRARQTP